jgi:hypothetical protein
MANGGMSGILGLAREWEKYKQGLPASITEGPQSLEELLRAQEGVPSERGGSAFLGAMDVMASAAGEPRPSREGMPREGGAWDTGLRVLGGTSAMLQGKPLPGSLGLDEPGKYEKVMSPIADVASMVLKGNLASRQAKLKRAGLLLGKRDQELREIDGWMDMNVKIRDHARGLPVEQQRAVFLDAADKMDERLFPGAGTFMRIEEEYAGVIPESREELFRRHPHLLDVFRVAGREGLQEVMTQPGFQGELARSADAEALGAITAWWEQIGAPHLRDHEPEIWKGIAEDGITEVGEVARAYEAIPENIRPPRLEFMSWFERNYSLLPFVDDEKMAASVKEKRLAEEAERESERAKLPLQKELARFKEELQGRNQG